MRFRSYPKIGASAGAVGGPWVATEKLHGANFVVAISAGEVRFGKRKEWLDEGAAFFGWQLLAHELGDRCRAVAEETRAPQVVCYGELHGGRYPHGDVPAIPGVDPVQTGVWYAPDLRWAIFDILVAEGDEDAGELLAHSDLEPLAAHAGLISVPVLTRGKRDQLERLAVEAPTAMPARYGLPALAGNLREGFVLKPDRRLSANERPAVKRKLPDFDDARFDEGRGWKPGYVSCADLCDAGRRLVNPARLASARSKVGQGPAAIIDEVVLDVAGVLATVFAEAWRDLDAADEARVLAALREAANRLGARRT